MPRSRLISPQRITALAILAISFLIALVCAIASVSHVSLLPPKLEPRDFSSAGAVAHMLVDRTPSRITDRGASSPYFDPLKDRSDLLAPLMASAPVVEYIAKRAGVPADQLGVVSPIAGPLGEPGSEQRAREILLTSRPYRLEIQSTGRQVVDVWTQAPTLPEAERLADAAIAGMRDYVRAMAAGNGPAPKDPADPRGKDPVDLVQLGPAQGAVLTAGTRPKLAALTFLLAFALAYGGLRGLVAVRRRRRGIRDEQPAPRPVAESAPAPRPATLTAAVPRDFAVPWSVPAPRAGGAIALRTLPRVAFGPRERATGDDGNWPHTTRALPWMLAAFIAMLWLVPFDSIQLSIHTPIDMKLDRLVLPFVAATWLFSFVLGGRDAPRVRFTRIHAALGAFVVIAFLSVILDAPALSQALELDTSIKKLPLLLSYLSLFLMMASVIRREEVPAFLNFILGLAVICALGMIWEDHLYTNVFFNWSGKLLPGLFEVALSDSTWDYAGRRLVHGPTSHPLVAASMLSMAFPIAVLGVIHARRSGERIVYGIAVAILMVGVLSTQRKTGFVAPVVGLLTLAFFRRRELLRLTPAAVALLIGIVVVAPGTVAPVLDQFKPDQLSGANTVNDRASDYDAVRPDVWTHVALGRGYGSYQPVGHRILDSDVLVRIIETGVLGLASFIMLGVSVVAGARRTIHSRHPLLAAPALAGAAAAVIFLVLGTLFDSTGFPQVPYIFMCFAALVAVVARAQD